MRNLFTREAMISPMTPMNRMFPQRVRSVFVKYPQALIAPNVPAVIKNVDAIDSDV